MKNRGVRKRGEPKIIYINDIKKLSTIVKIKIFAVKT